MEQLKSTQLSNTRVAELLELTIVITKQCNYNSRSAAHGKIRLVENRLKCHHLADSAKPLSSAENNGYFPGAWSNGVSRLSYNVASEFPWTMVY